MNREGVTMNAFEKQAMDLLADRLAAYPEETRRLGRLDDRVLGWMIFRPHLLFAGALGGCAAMTAGACAAGTPMTFGARVVLHAVLVFVVFGAAGLALGRWQWRRITLALLEVLADAVAAGRGQPNAAPMPLGLEHQLSAVISRLRRLRR